MIDVISDTHIPERMAKLPRKFLDKIKPDDIIFSAIGGSVYDRHAGCFVNLEAFKELESVGTLYAICGNREHLAFQSRKFVRKFNVSFRTSPFASYGVLSIDGSV
jgi:predicted phosphodiesterase